MTVDSARMSCICGAVKFVTGPGITVTKFRCPSCPSEPPRPKLTLVKP